mmetsp:Transcript_22734/g.73115  ORF Transcript_22734/g.73115 Transcript_22734/m.73115 type:complete len:383 (-) Transcript_22734:795-1943(-)
MRRSRRSWSCNCHLCSLSRALETSASSCRASSAVFTRSVDFSRSAVRANSRASTLAFSSSDSLVFACDSRRFCSAASSRARSFPRKNANCFSASDAFSDKCCTRASFASRDNSATAFDTANDASTANFTARCEAEEAGGAEEAEAEGASPSGEEELSSCGRSSSSSTKRTPLARASIFCLAASRSPPRLSPRRRLFSPPPRSLAVRDSSSRKGAMTFALASSTRFLTAALADRWNSSTASSKRASQSARNFVKVSSKAARFETTRSLRSTSSPRRAPRAWARASAVKDNVVPLSSLEWTSFARFERSAISSRNTRRQADDSSGTRGDERTLAYSSTSLAKDRPVAGAPWIFFGGDARTARRNAERPSRNSGLTPSSPGETKG